MLLFSFGPARHGMPRIASLSNQLESGNCRISLRMLIFSQTYDLFYIINFCFISGVTGPGTAATAELKVKHVRISFCDFTVRCTL